MEKLILTRASRSSGAGAARLWRVDAAIAGGLAAMTLAICLYFAPRGFHLGFVDMGHDGYQLRQVLDLSQGKVIFRDTFDQYGPLNGYLNTAGFLALGRRLLAVKYFIAGWYALIVVALYLMARHWLGPGLAAFSAIVWLGLAPFYNHGIMISPHVYALFFQAVATIIVLRTRDQSPRRFAAVGLLAGLCWAVKQNMGAFFLLAILTHLVLVTAMRASTWRRAAAATMAVSAAFAFVVGATMALIWWQGALRDWYLQTIAFPRDFYLLNAGRAAQAGAASRVAAQLWDFVTLQFTQPVFWMLIRIVVLVAAVVQLARRRRDDDLTLMACITAFLWLGAYPSANFMHQWWTASLALAPFVVCMHRMLGRWVIGDRRTVAATVGVIAVIVSPGIRARADATAYRAGALTETILEPPLYRGIRTDPPTRNAFAALYQVMAGYRADHPGTRIVSIESADGWTGGIAESLPLLTFFDDNGQTQPVYWRLPVLSTTVYPRYAEAAWRQVREERPLIVDHRPGRYRASHIAGYRLLAAAQSDVGHWYVHAPECGSSETDTGQYFAFYGRTDVGWRLNTNVDGAWRGRVESSRLADEVIQIVDEDPLEITDPALRSAPGPVNVYTWPSNLPAVRIDRSIEPLATDRVSRSGKVDIVREFEGGSWMVDGPAASSYAYLLQWPEQPQMQGTQLVVRGEIFEGGLQIGLLEQGQWYGSVCMSRRGAFEAVVQIQKPGTYAVVAANCVTTSWWQRTRRYPFRAALAVLSGGFWPNHVKVIQAGWHRDHR